MLLKLFALMVEPVRAMWWDRAETLRRVSRYDIRTFDGVVGTHLRQLCGEGCARLWLDLWVVSQIWLDSDSNESSQSQVSRENQGYESSQSRITLNYAESNYESELSQLDTADLSQSWVTYYSEDCHIWRHFVIQILVLYLSIAEHPTMSHFAPPTFSGKAPSMHMHGCLWAIRLGFTDRVSDRTCPLQTKITTNTTAIFT